MSNPGIRYADGVPCCCSFDDAHNPIPSNPAHHCKACQEYFAAMARFPAPATLEGRRHSAADQASLDEAGTHAFAVLDKLRQAGARVPGRGQQTEADVEQAERGAEVSYAPPDPYESGITAMRAAMATDDSRFELSWKSARQAELTAERERRLASPPTFVTLSGEYAPPDPYEAAVTALRASEAKR